jgi:hypothetical protein
MSRKPGRRNFLKKGLLGVLGGLFGLYTVPHLITTFPGTNVSAMGQKQLDLLLASKRLMEKTGILRAFAISQYANNGEVQMDWTVWIPPEEEISSDADNLARQVLQLTGQ